MPNLAPRGGGPNTSRDYREGFNQFISDLGCTHALTLAPNSHAGLSRETARARLWDDLRAFLGRFDRALLGRRWYKLPASQRTEGLFTAEKLSANPHVHGAVRLPNSSIPMERLEGLVEEIWGSVAPAGSANLQRMYSAGWGDYIIKEFSAQDAEFRFASEFHPIRS